MSYLDGLRRELERARIGGRLRQRILAEFADHMSCDPEAKLGSPVDLARQFADDLGTARTRRAVFGSFAGLAVAGALAGAVGAATGRAGIALPKAHPTSPVLFDLGLALAALGGQVALAAGLLAGLRGLIRRRAPVIVREEAVVIRRRSAVALVAGLACLMGVALVGLEASHAASWWRTLAVASAGAGACAIAAALAHLWAAREVLPFARGSAGDIFEDLGWIVPSPLRGHPWRFALVVAGAIVVIVAVAGIVQSDPYDGALRGLADGLACMTGFALLGRYLGLRPADG
jgi:hypothetical protein